MIRFPAMFAMMIVAMGAGACSSFKPYDYDAHRSSESPEARAERKQREARSEQQRIVRCETMGQAARRDVPDCRS